MKWRELVRVPETFVFVRTETFLNPWIYERNLFLFQNIQLYVRQNESSVLDSYYSTSELNDVFNQMDSVSSSNQHEVFSNTNILMGKRRHEW